MKYILNSYGNRQAVDEDNVGICPDCNRIHTNFGQGVSCETCQDEELEYCEQMYEDFKAIEKT